MFFPKLTRRASYTGQAGIYSYRKYKSEIAEDCQQRCVYCDGHGTSFGGVELMELDHFRPKAEHLFPELRNTAENLVLACRSCNGKKRDDWPAGKSNSLTVLGNAGYVDPFLSERALYFQVDDYGAVIPLQSPAQYVIEQLCLNRRFAMAIRRRRLLRARLQDAVNELMVTLEQCQSKEQMQPTLNLLKTAVAELFALFDETSC